MNNVSFNRRQFLISFGALVVTAAIPGMAAASSAAAGANSTKPALVPEELDSWVAVAKDGGVHAFYGKVDLGQGLEVAIAQIVAEELDVPVAKVSVVMGDSAMSCDQGGASNASGIQEGSLPLRNAAAEARRLLLEMGAKKLNAPIELLQVIDGVISVSGDSSKRVSYAELIGGNYFNSKVTWNKRYGNALNVSGNAKPKAVSEYKIVGKPVPRRDVAWCVFGARPEAPAETSYVTDVRLPNMLHARVIRTPSAGCVPVQVDEASIAKIKGARVVRVADFLAVVAENEWDAVKAASGLKVEWSAPKNPFPEYDKLYDHIRKAPVVKRTDEVNEGDVAGAMKNAAKIIEAEYEWPFQSHASMGPACAVADVKSDKATIWTGTQKPHSVQEGVAKLLGLPREKVHSIWVKGPGSYGRNDAGDAALDAAFLSKLTRRPVRVQGMRHDGTAWDPKSPASVHRVRAALDASGKITAYEFLSKGFSRVDVESNEADPAQSLLGMALGHAYKPGVGFGVPSESYVFDNKLAGWEVIAPFLAHSSPLRTSHFRDPVGLQIHFASEQFVDEMALATNQDPVAFRLKHLTDPRQKEAIKTVAERAGWSPRTAPADRSGDVLKGRGIAYATRNGTIVAVVAEVEVERETGRIWGRKFTVSHDCGLVINPQQLKATIVKGLTQALSRSLLEEVRFDRNMVTSNDWIGYPILEAKDAPETIDVVLIDRPTEKSTGAGEAVCRIVPAAVANAFFDATGVRLRHAPMTPDAVKAALAKA